MIVLHDEHQKIYEQIAKEKAAQQPHGNLTPAANGHASSPLLPKSGSPGGAKEDLATRLQGTDLMKFLGFVNFYKHGAKIMRYYLVGCAYHHGAHSVRHILELLASPPPQFLAEDLALKVLNTIDLDKNNLCDTITKLEELLNASLVIRLGDNLPFPGLNENGEAFWKVVAEYLRENW